MARLSYFSRRSSYPETVSHMRIIRKGEDSYGEARVTTGALDFIYLIGIMH